LPAISARPARGGRQLEAQIEPKGAQVEQQVAMRRRGGVPGAGETAKRMQFARSGRPGPVLIDLPKDVSAQTCVFSYPDKVDLPVNGAIGHPATARSKWTTPKTAGHYCIQVELLWPDDANPANNLGQENVNVQKLASPATFQFTLRNDSRFRRRFELRADAYERPVRIPCPERPPNAPPRGNIEADPFARHRLKNHPVPEGWKVEIQPSDVIVLPGEEEQLVTVIVTAPAGFVGRQPINVNAFDGDELMGGVTLYAES
jgi:hypothetical protein